MCSLFFCVADILNFLAKYLELDVRAYLDAVFPDTWIGRRGPTEYPSRSPDLTPMDFFCGDT